MAAEDDYLRENDEWIAQTAAAEGLAFAFRCGHPIPPMTMWTINPIYLECFDCAASEVARKRAERGHMLAAPISLTGGHPSAAVIECRASMDPAR